MNTAPDQEKGQRPSASARAEAAAWIARLHGPNRTPEVEAGFRCWLSENRERAAAVELVTDVWEKSARLQRRPVERLAGYRPPRLQMSLSRAALAALVIAAVAVCGTFLYLRTEGVTTTIGEQRTLTLADGTRVYLNTDTQVVEHYDEQMRRVELRRGEALFEVAKRPDWPFVVFAGDQQVRALGTSFVVRREAQRLAVTLVEGKVTVTSSAHDGNPEQAEKTKSTPPQPSELSRPSVTLAPGERLTFRDAQPPQIDRPSMDRVTAWQQGQVALDNTPLADAIAEMNRYSRTQLILADPGTSSIKISGVFRAGDQDNFAQAVAYTYKLDVQVDSDEIVLRTRSP